MGTWCSGYVVSQASGCQYFGASVITTGKVGEVEQTRPEPLNLAIFWAKTDREHQTAAYHPLGCHLLDVGLVVRAMWNDLLPGATRRAVAKTLETDENTAGGWISFWAALHDLGKLSPSFQLNDPRAIARLARHNFPTRRPGRRPLHGTISALALRELLRTEFQHPAPLAGNLATIVGGHHGIFPTFSEVNSINSAEFGGEPWAAARLDLVRLVAHQLSIPSAPPSGQIDHPAALIVAGLITVADWIGSNSRFFTYAATGAEDDPQIQSQ